MRIHAGVVNREVLEKIRKCKSVSIYPTEDRVEATFMSEDEIVTVYGSPASMKEFAKKIEDELIQKRIKTVCDEMIEEKLFGREWEKWEEEAILESERRRKKKRGKRR